MTGQNPYTHFMGDQLTRAEQVERFVIETIEKSCARVPDQKRVWGKVFELKHSSSVTQIGRILAQKRGLRAELGAIVCCLHDIYVNETGDAKDHAAKGAVIAENLFRELKKFSADEIATLAEAIREHSNKHLTSPNPYAELVKDADVFDCSLYEGTHDAYVHEKPAETCRAYFDRIKKVRQEFGLSREAQWDSLEPNNK